MNRFKPGSNTLMGKHKRIRSGIDSGAKSSTRYLGKPNLDIERKSLGTTNDWNELFNVSSHNVEDLQEIFLHELENKENEIRVLRH